jgi:hypothetical protein
MTARRRYQQKAVSLEQAFAASILTFSAAAPYISSEICESIALRIHFALRGPICAKSVLRSTVPFASQRARVLSAEPLITLRLSRHYVVWMFRLQAW